MEKWRGYLDDVSHHEMIKYLYPFLSLLILHPSTVTENFLLIHIPNDLPLLFCPMIKLR